MALTTGVFSRVLVCCLILAIVSGPSAHAFENQLRSIRVRLDSGTLGPKDAAEELTDRIVAGEVSAQGLDAYARKRLTVREYRDFRRTLDSALSGIDPSTLTPGELAEVADQALQGARSRGLAWSGCVGVYGGITALLIGIALLFVQKAKVLTEGEIRERFKEKRLAEAAKFDKRIRNALEWETSIPAAITSYENGIVNARQRMKTIGGDISWAESTLYYAERNLNDAGSEEARRQYQAEVDAARAALDSLRSEELSLPGLIPAYERAIMESRELLAQYRANPDLAIVEARGIEQLRAAALSVIQSEEDQRVAESLANEAAADLRVRQLKVRGAVLTAVGAYFAVDGAGSCQE